MPGGADTLPAAATIKANADAFAGPVPKNYRETIVGTGSEGGTKEVTFASGDDVRHTFDRGNIHNEWGTYHGEKWEQNGNGLVVIVADDPGHAAPDAITTTVKRVTAPIDAFVVSKLNARSAGTRTYYDPTTYRVLRIEDVGPTGTRTTTFDDLEHAGDRTLPRHWTVTSPDAKLAIHYERTEYVAGAATDDDVREAATRRQLVEFPPGVTRVDLPVRIINHAVYVRVNIGSRAVDFQLDTGASTILVDADFARGLGLQLVNASSEVTARRYTAYNAIVPNLAIGSLHMRDIVVDVGPMPDVHTSDVKPVGLLGFDFLAQLGVTIDYAHAAVSVVPAAAFSPPADPSTYAFDIRIGERVPMVTVKVAGFVAERVFFDTGGAGDLLFFDYFTRRYPQAFSAAEDLGSAGMAGVGGRFAAEIFRLHDVQLGHIHFQDFFALRVPVSAAYDYDADGLIGNDLLSKFVVDLDYTDGRVYLTPSRETKGELRPVKG